MGLLSIIIVVTVYNGAPGLQIIVDVFFKTMFNNQSPIHNQDSMKLCIIMNKYTYHRQLMIQLQLYIFFSFIVSDADITLL
jgi:hypothetical protein